MNIETDKSFPFNLPIPELQRYAKLLKQENKSLPDKMEKMPPSAHIKQTLKTNGRLVEVWRSNKYLAQVYAPEKNGLERISICRCEVDVSNRRWRDGLTWEELIQVKREIGYGEFDAMEAYPADSRIVNVANFRHLFVSRTPVEWMWGN